MGLAKKTTILFPPDLHRHLARLARSRGVSIGHLVRSACERSYGYTSEDDRRRAVDELGQLALPVADGDRMKRESVPHPDDLLP